MAGPQFACPFADWRTAWLLPSFGVYGETCTMQCVWLHVSIQSICVQAKACDLLGHSKNTFSFFRTFPLFGCAASSLPCAGFLCRGKSQLPFAVLCGFTLWWPLLLQSVGSRLVGFSRCSTWSQCLCCAGSGVVVHWLRCSVACGILPRPSIEPMSPTLACKFWTTRPPGKSSKSKTLSSRMAAEHHSAFPGAIEKNSVTPCLCQHLVSSVF